MSSSNANKSLAVRAAAILTNSEVKTTDFDLNSAWGSQVSFDLSFTIGSLTNLIVKAYVSMDGSTYLQVALNGVLFQETITATATRAYILPFLPGWKYAGLGLTGTGTVTSSTATVTARYLKRGSQ